MRMSGNCSMTVCTKMAPLISMTTSVTRLTTSEICCCMGVRTVWKVRTVLVSWLA